MAATDPITPEPRRCSFRLPHWGWFLLATDLLVLGYVGLSVWRPYHQEQQVIGMLEA
jgi:type VI protein secretion system component VasF